MQTGMSKEQTAKFKLCRSIQTDSFYGDYWVYIALNEPDSYDQDADVYEALEAKADAGHLRGIDLYGNVESIGTFPDHPRPKTNRPPVN